MALDPSIILSGRPADILGAMQQGNALAGQVNESRRQREMAGFLGENAGALMQGDTNALTQFAQYDPQAAFDMMGRQQDRQWRQEDRQYQRERDSRTDARQTRQDERADQQWRWQVEEHARTLSAQEREAQAQQVEDAVKMGLALPDAAAWDQMMATQAPDLVGQFDNRQALANRYMDVASILRGREGPKPQSPQGRFAADQAAGFVPKDAVFQTGGNTTVNNQIGGGNDLRKKLSEKEGEQWATAIEAGSRAGSLSQDLEMMAELSTIAPQGPIVGRFAEAFPGVNSAADAFNSVVKRVAPTLREPGSGSTSDIEYDGMLKSLPALRNKPEANAAIIGMMQAKQQIMMEKAAAVAAFQQGEATEQETRAKLQELNGRSIMTPQLQALIGATGPDSGGDVPEGIDPNDWQHLTEEEKALFR